MGADIRYKIYQQNEKLKTDVQMERVRKTYLINRFSTSSSLKMDLLKAPEQMKA